MAQGQPLCLCPNAHPQWRSAVGVWSLDCGTLICVGLHSYTLYVYVYVDAESMNLFLLHSNARKAAQMHCDKHCVKMILEVCQLLYTAHWVINPDTTWNYDVHIHTLTHSHTHSHTHIHTLNLCLS